jgi:hypothetical protein
LDDDRTMHVRNSFEGSVVQAETPDWEALLRFAGGVVDDFMWMFEIRLEDGRRVHAYKHVWTRNYLHLDEGGRAFIYKEPDSYQQVNPAWLLGHVLDAWALTSRMYDISDGDPDRVSDAEEVP